MSDDQPDWDAAMAEACWLAGSDRYHLRRRRWRGPGANVRHGHGRHPKGIEIALEGSRAGETYRLPPDMRAFFPATKGEYRLRSTGEVVVDPDFFTTTWSVQRPH